LSAGWCFVFQASSVANDSFGVIYALAAVDLALRARENKKIADLWLSTLAIALATGIKQTNIPLVLPWLVAVWPDIPLILKNKKGTIAIASVALLVSILPVSLFNLKYAGSWLPVENSGIASIGQFHLDPFWGIVGNAFCIPLQNLVPPFFYNGMISPWNEHLAAFTATPFGAHFSSFETFGFLSAVREHGVSEANAGVGLGVCILLAVSILAALILRPTKISRSSGKFFRVLRAAPWLALLIFMAKVGSYENARQLAPYYPFLFPPFLIMAGQSSVVRRRVWQWLGLATMIISAFLVITLSERPLFPAAKLFSFLHAKFPESKLVFNEAIQYLASMRRGMEIRRECLRESVPSDAKVIGYFPKMNNGDEPGLWFPYGLHRVELIRPEDSPEYVRSTGASCLVVSSTVLQQSGETLQQWLQKYNATIIAEFSVYGGFMTGPPPPDFNGLFVARLD
jgi:hypothetical protein